MLHLFEMAKCRSLVLLLMTIYTAAAIKTGTPIKIGGLFPFRRLSGTLDGGGIERWAAFRMGIDDVNALPTLLTDNNLTHVTEDSKRDPQSVIFGAFDVANAGSVAVVGAASSTPSMSANRVLSRLGIPQISYSSTAPILSDKSQFPTFMRTVPADSVQGEAMITLARDVFGWSKVGLLSTTDGYGSGGAASVVTQASLRDVKILSAQTFNVGAKADSLAPKLAIMRDALVRIIVFFGDGDDFIEALTASLIVGLANKKVAWVVSDSTAQDIKVAALTNNATLLSSAAGIIGIRPTIGSGSIWESFLDRWSARPQETFEYGFTSTGLRSINAFAPYAYDAVFAIAHALHGNASASGSELHQRLLDVSFEGVTGPVQFDINGDRVGGQFAIVNLDHVGHFKPIGLWDSVRGFQSQANIIWRDGTTNVPVDAACVQQNPDPELCPMCPPASYLDVTGECIVCPPGMHSDAWGATLCLPCRSGYSNPYPNQTDCVPCPAGFNQPEIGMPSCDACPIGSYSFPRSVRCFQCSRTSFANATRLEQCLECPEHTEIADYHGPNHTSITQCECLKGFYNIHGQPGQPCEPCPFGAVCEGGTRLPYPKEGFYGLRHAPKQFWECSPRSRCLGGPNFGCAGSQTGMLCSECAGDHWKLGSSGMCDVCPDNRTTRDLMTLAGVVVILFIWYLIRHLLAGRFEALKMVFLYLQVLGIISRFKLRWSPLLQRVFAVLSFVNFQVDFIGPHCSMKWNYVISTYLVLTLPLLFAAYYALKYAINFGHHRLVLRSKRFKGFPIFARSQSDLDSELDGSVRSLCIFCNAVFHTIAIRTFSPMFCDPLPDDTSILRFSPGIECGTTAHVSLSAVCATLGLAWVIGIPYLFFRILRYGRQNMLMMSPRFVRKFGPLYARYEPEWYWFELTLIARRGLYALLLVALHPYPVFQALGGMLVILVQSALQTHSEPFIRYDVDVLDLFMGLSLFMILCCGVVQYSTDLHVAYPNAVSNSEIVGATVLTLTGVLGVAVSFRNVWSHLRTESAELVMSSRGMLKPVPDDDRECAKSPAASVGVVNPMWRDDILSQRRQLLPTLHLALETWLTTKWVASNPSDESNERFDRVARWTTRFTGKDSIMSEFSHQPLAEMHRAIAGAMPDLTDFLLLCEDDVAIQARIFFEEYAHFVNTRHSVDRLYTLFKFYKRPGINTWLLQAPQEQRIQMRTLLVDMAFAQADNVQRARLGLTKQMQNRRLMAPGHKASTSTATNEGHKSRSNHPPRLTSESRKLSLHNITQAVNEAALGVSAKMRMAPNFGIDVLSKGHSSSGTTPAATPGGKDAHIHLVPRDPGHITIDVDAAIRENHANAAFELPRKDSKGTLIIPASEDIVASVPSRRMRGASFSSAPGSGADKHDDIPVASTSFEPQLHGGSCVGVHHVIEEGDENVQVVSRTNSLSCTGELFGLAVRESARSHEVAVGGKDDGHVASDDIRKDGDETFGDDVANDDNDDDNDDDDDASYRPVLVQCSFDVSVASSRPPVRQILTDNVHDIATLAPFCGDDEMNADIDGKDAQISAAHDLSLSSPTHDVDATGVNSHKPLAAPLNLSQDRRGRLPPTNISSPNYTIDTSPLPSIWRMSPRSNPLDNSSYL